MSVNQKTIQEKSPAPECLLSLKEAINPLFHSIKVNSSQVWESQHWLNSTVPAETFTKQRSLHRKEGEETKGWGIK